MSERKTIIRTAGLKKHYTVGGNTVRALDGVDMSVLQGEFVCVAGRSGSGKSTMLNMLAGLEPPTEGEIIVRGKHHLEAMDEEQRTRFRRRYIGFVFQSYNNLPQYTALENVALPLAIRGVPEDERNWLAWQALSRVGLRGHVDHRPAELSGGRPCHYYGALHRAGGRAYRKPGQPYRPGGHGTAVRDLPGEEHHLHPQLP